MTTYRTVWMALGISIGISTWLRPRIGYKLWRSLHVLTLVIFAFATFQGIGAGSDTQTPWAMGIYLTSIALVGILFFRRVFVRPKKQKHLPTQRRSQRETPTLARDSMVSAGS